LGVLLAGRGADLLSTRLATPRLVLEANPIARKLGWRWGTLVNVLLCVLFAGWLLPAIIVTTTSLLVAAHNLRNAWLMRTMGEQAYGLWMGERLRETPLSLFLLCLFGEALFTAAVGVAVVALSGDNVALLGVGMGIVGYTIALLLYTLISVWRRRRRAG